jgi:6-pyruvoyltetrahydropterin/6-carboxytetrahydropterin synthase
MVYITRREHFNAAHRLFRPEFSDEKNEQVFGKCSNPNWHGHNYIMYVTVKGNVNPDTGFVMNLKELSVILKTHIIEPLDHKNMNLEVPFMQGIMPSTENLATAIWNELEKHLQHTGAQLHCVRIEETENNSVEYYGKQS